jgi:hypothetical protein
MKRSVDTFAQILHDGSVYVPTFAVTAVVCLVTGAVLVRRGWTWP